MSENRLRHETSPYLLQHADNPVHWNPWGPDALATASKLDKPILLSVGYAACHWCHVMAHESFEDDAIAGVMNEHFVCIKVDREERPDIDAIYQGALAILGTQGGWPLTMFLTPDGEPFWGGTYFPSEPKYGRPGFPAILTRIAEIYHHDKATIDQNRKALVQHLGEMGRPTANDNPLSPKAVTLAARDMIGMVDHDLGGIAGAPKFPNMPFFELLWRAGRQTEDAEYRNAVNHTLERMSEGGIYDHLGGGFARYSTDAGWLVPHFEKMLYDNAAIIELMTTVFQDNRSPLFERRITETVKWLLREMIAESGAFAATLDADSEGVEGKFYIWNSAEITDYLGTETDFFCQTYGARQGGNWPEGGQSANILNRLHHPRPPDEMDEQRLEPLRALLLKVRDTRIRPGWDDKVLADWNGQMISALVGAAGALSHTDWSDAARRAFDAICEHMTRTDQNGLARLNHSLRQGKARHEGLLDDYAQMARAALSLYELDGRSEDLDWAKAWAATADARFWDDIEAGYYFTADDAEALIVRTKSASDNATPSGNAVMLEVLARLYLLTGAQAYRERADILIASFASMVSERPSAYAAFLNAADSHMNALQIVIVGDRKEADTQALIKCVHGASLPGRVLQIVAPGADLGAHHPAHGKGQEGGKATAYVCRGQTCSLPVTTPSELAALLSPTA